MDSDRAIVRREDGALTIGNKQCSIAYRVFPHETGDCFALLEFEVNADEPGPALHYHAEEMEVFYVLEGQLRFNVDDGTVVCRAGDVVVIPPGVPHAWKPVGETPARFLSLFTPGHTAWYFIDRQELQCQSLRGELQPHAADTARALLARKYGMIFHDESQDSPLGDEMDEMGRACSNVSGRPDGNELKHP